MNGNLAVYSSRQKGTLLSAPSMYVCQWQSTSQCENSATWTVIPNSHYTVLSTVQEKLTDVKFQRQEATSDTVYMSQELFTRKVLPKSPQIFKLCCSYAISCRSGKTGKTQRYGNVWSWKVMVK